MAGVAVYPNNAAKQRAYRDRERELAEHQQVFFGWVVEARKLGIVLHLNLAELFDVKASKQEVWRSLAREVGIQLRAARKASKPSL
jgi:hypothetical protein